MLHFWKKIGSDVSIDNRIVTYVTRDTLGHSHSIMLYHCDICPSNVSKSEEIKTILRNRFTLGLKRHIKISQVSQSEMTAHDHSH